MDKNSLGKKGLAVAIILFVIGMSVIPSTGTVVEKKFPMPTSYDGNTLYVGGDGSGNYTSIQDAIDNASDGDTVFVYDDSSPYYENIVVDKSINLIGENRDTTIIDGRNWRVIYVRDDWINISGFTVQNCGNTTGDAGIYITSSNNTISNNIIMLNNWTGIWMFGHNSNYNTISDNIVFNSRIGIGVSSGAYNIISNNNISHQIEGVRLASSSNNTVIGNNITSHSLMGIYISFSNDNNIYHNNIINNTQNAYDQCNNTWDNGYWSGGNYWSDYTGNDFYHGPGQNETGRDWRGDTPYNITGGSNQDMYPLILPYESEPPFAVIEHPSDGLITSEHNVTIIGYITDNVGLVKSGTIYGSEWGGVTYKTESLPPYELTPQIDFNFNKELEPGWNKIGIHATDPSDNYGENIVLVYYYPDIVYVDDDFNETTEGWQITHFDNIQDGINAVTENGTVYVYNGTYYENVLVDKSINLIGENKETTIIDGNRSVYISADWVNISEFTIHCGIFLDSCGNNIISDNIICSNSSWNGIELSYSCNNIITDNKILDHVHGIDLFHSSNNIISDNIISNSISLGIFILSSNNNNITGNKISNCFFGIMLFFSSENIIEKNNFIGNKRHAIFSDLWRNILIKNCWDSNYWDKWIGFGPKLIFGRIGLNGLIPWVNFDWHPAKESYPI